MQRNVKLALIYGGSRPGRFCDAIGLWAIAEIDRHAGFDLDVVDPAGCGAVDEAALKRRIGAADAFLIVTPEYNHSYPAQLKALIDGLDEEWRAKPVAFVSYGGLSGGLRAVEHLRNVFAELHAVAIRDGVAFPNVWSLFDEADALREPAPVSRALATTLGRLRWWAEALRAARAADAYGEAA